MNRTARESIYIDPDADAELVRLSKHFEWARGFALVKVSTAMLEELGQGTEPVTFTATRDSDGTFKLVISRV